MLIGGNAGNELFKLLLNFCWYYCFIVLHVAVNRIDRLYCNTVQTSAYFQLAVINLETEAETDVCHLCYNWWVLMYCCICCRYLVSNAMDYNAPVEPHMHRPKAGSVRESIVTQGDLQLKQLVQKQMNTDVTLSGYVFICFMCSLVILSGVNVNMLYRTILKVLCITETFKIESDAHVKCFGQVYKNLKFKAVKFRNL